ncbi:hypothetical protein LTR60_001008 [Cryomyces antarcticus]|nr:hypothetical protein LTR60_001008 [Cryomyces antarcticus]
MVNAIKDPVIRNLRALCPKTSLMLPVYCATPEPVAFTTALPPPSPPATEPQRLCVIALATPVGTLFDPETGAVTLDVRLSGVWPLTFWSVVGVAEVSYLSVVVDPSVKALRRWLSQMSFLFRVVVVCATDAGRVLMTNVEKEVETPEVLVGTVTVLADDTVKPPAVVDDATWLPETGWGFCVAEGGCDLKTFLVLVTLGTGFAGVVLTVDTVEMVNEV